MTLTHDQTSQLLAILADPAMRNGAGDGARAEIIRNEVLPALRKACQEFGIECPDWLHKKPFRKSIAPAGVTLQIKKDGFPKAIFTWHPDGTADAPWFAPDPIGKGLEGWAEIPESFSIEGQDFTGTGLDDPVIMSHRAALLVKLGYVPAWTGA